MKPYYAREFKKYGIRAANSPQEGYSVAGVVVVLDAEGRSSAYIKFSKDFETAVGKAMPYGVGPEMPCYIKVMQIRNTHVWRVFAFYVGEHKGRLLWQTTERPAWVKKRVSRAPEASTTNT